MVCSREAELGWGVQRFLPWLLWEQTLSALPCREMEWNPLVLHLFLPTLPTCSFIHTAGHCHLPPLALPSQILCLFHPLTEMNLFLPLPLATWLIFYFYSPCFFLTCEFIFLRFLYLFFSCPTLAQLPSDFSFVMYLFLSILMFCSVWNALNCGVAKKHQTVRKR